MFIPSVCFVYEIREVCATHVATGQSQLVQAHIYKGSELNKITNTHRFNSQGKYYVVIFWENNRISIIEMPSYFYLFSMGIEGTDQTGHKWIIEWYSYMCD